MEHLLLSSKQIQLSLSLQYTTELLRKAGLKGFENKTVQYQDLPGSPVVKTLPFNARRVGSIPGWGTKTPNALWCDKTKTINKQTKKNSPVPISTLQLVELGCLALVSYAEPSHFPDRISLGSYTSPGPHSQILIANQHLLKPWGKPGCPRVSQTYQTRHYFANRGPSSQGYGFSSGHVWM